MLQNNNNYWKQKISAHLHDSPNKILDIIGHEASAKSFEKIYALSPDEQFRKEADFAASAADRIPWPTCLASEYDIQHNPLKHPLSGHAIVLDEKQNTNSKAEEDAHRTIPSIENSEQGDEDLKLSFLALWRFWQNWASDRSPQLGYYPAETRLPDHSIWSHLSVTSAMQGCYGGSRADWDSFRRETTRALPDHPSLLLFTIGPVQDFIAAARTTRDLWSGSYLLSYLCATALSKIASDFGPDHVIFPNLKGQPLIDFLLREDWKKCGSSKASNFWEAFDYMSPDGKSSLLTPSLPNRFLALLPTKMTQHSEWDSIEAYAKELTATIRKELKAIADSVASALSSLGSETFLQDRFDQQVDKMLEIHWQLMPLDQDVKQIRDQADYLPSDEGFKPLSGLDAVLEMVKAMPAGDRDSRYFQKGNTADAKLTQSTTAWPALYSLTGWKLDGVKSLRSFTANNSGIWKKGRAENKDSLSGKETACLIAPDTQEACERLRKDCFKHAPEKSIKSNEFLGAATLIKRFWHLTWLCADKEFRPEDFSMPNTHSIAMHAPFADTANNEGSSEDSDKYYAILALDGDEMGKWVSGAKLPKMREVLSDEAVKYFDGNNNKEFLKQNRPLSPSFHLQFSEMLGNFSLHCARLIVESYDGRLIYAGGDDVLAMLPAGTAIACAATLRAAFRGDATLPEWRPELFQSAPEGCIQLKETAARKRYRDSYPSDEDPLVSDPHRFPALVPGPAANVSCGIAIGHIKAPLQDMVKAAQAAEKRAKSKLNREACAISIFKRSGEIREWGFNWDKQSNSAPVFFMELLQCLQDSDLSNRFPYALTQRLEPFVSDLGQCTENFAEQAEAIVSHELQHCLKQHLKNTHTNSDKGSILEAFRNYWTSLDERLSNQPLAKIDDCMGLLSTLAWINKH